jgi:predicted Rossmann fold flavoprotein
MTAIAAARESPALQPLVLDSASRLGAKILISGGGRCNVTNRAVAAGDFNGGSRRTIDRVLRAFTAAETRRFFEALGVGLHEEPGGKIFPDSQRARTVLDALVGEAVRLGARVLTSWRVDAVERQGAGLRVCGTRGVIETPRVVLTTGGLSVPRTGSDGHGLTMAAALGHTIVPTTPALVPLLLEGEMHRRLAGVSHPATVRLHVGGRLGAAATGSLLWTHTGVSGPVVLDLSRHWHRAVQEGADPTVSLAVGEDRTFEAAETFLLRESASRPRTSLGTVLASRIPAAVGTELLQALGIDGSVSLAHLPREARRRVAHALSAWRLPVTGSRGYAAAEATAGGVTLEEVDPATMASAVCPGLYLAGEMLDVDGRIGGFNFQWAWASGTVAGRAAARP